ncbi:hypothetical protein [Nocardia sp. NPDC051570]|uniref:hypothetical protein n=1 Tax=Nocardia sp. NPDC051570 TaxID=3364324 RepID=UPI003795DC6C
MRSPDGPAVGSGIPAGSGNESTPTTVARVSQAATAVRWAAHRLGVTLVPASAVPLVVSQPVVAALRRGAGPAEAAPLELLCQETWHKSAPGRADGAMSR